MIHYCRTWLLYRERREATRNWSSEVVKKLLTMTRTEVWTTNCEMFLVKVEQFSRLDWAGKLTSVHPFESSVTSLSQWSCSGVKSASVCRSLTKVSFKEKKVFFRIKGKNYSRLGLNAVKDWKINNKKLTFFLKIQNTDYIQIVPLSWWYLWLVKIVFSQLSISCKYSMLYRCFKAYRFVDASRSKKISGWIWHSKEAMIVRVAVSLYFCRISKRKYCFIRYKQGDAVKRRRVQRVSKN